MSSATFIIQFLEAQLDVELNHLRIPVNLQMRIKTFLNVLKLKHVETYLHSIRVGLLAQKIAAYLRLDETAMLYAGLLHDIGKVQTPTNVLDKTEGWTPKDAEEIKSHVIDGHRLLAGYFDFTAEVILYHHRFQKDGYPQNLPQSLHPYSEATRDLIPKYGRILALADCFDALHRVNEKMGEKRQLSNNEIKAKILELNPDLEHLIICLYNDRILQ